MSRTFTRLVFVLAVCALWAGQAGGQLPEQTQKEPRARLEAFQAKTGAVVIEGYSSIGTVLGLSGNRSLEVTAVQVTDTATGNTQRGVMIEIGRSEKAGARGMLHGDTGQGSRSFVDYDEIDSLIKGIDYLSTATSGITKLDRFEATYRTKGHFGVTVFGSRREEAVTARVESGSPPTGASLALPQLVALRAMIEQAKGKLDEVK